MTGHSAHDDAGYVPKKLFEEWERKDPIRRFENDLKERGLLDAGAVGGMEERIEGELDQAVAWAEAQPYPDPEECLTGVYHEQA
jgi:TPP-dependent pyruvate/acetoin dehydrogenase alpha subunit